MVTQNVQRLLQPSCTLMKARVLLALPVRYSRRIGSCSNSGALMVDAGVDELDQSRLVLVGHDLAGACHRRQLLWGDSGVAAGQQDLGGFVLPVDAAGLAASIFGGLSGDGASVDDHLVGAGAVGHDLVTLRQ